MTLNRMLRDRGLVPCVHATTWLGRRQNAQKAWDDLDILSWMYWVLRRAKPTKKFKRQVTSMLTHLRSYADAKLKDHVETCYSSDIQKSEIYLLRIIQMPDLRTDYIRKFFPNPPDLKPGR